MIDMATLVPIILLLAGFYVGWNIGANDAANCIGTTVGAGIISFRNAALLMGVCVIIGGVLQGHKVMKTVGKGIIITSEADYQQVNQRPAPSEMATWFPSGNLPDHAIFAALISAGLFVTLATFSSIPVSTSQAIVGGVAGVGLGITFFDTTFLRMGVLLKILTCWVLSPVLTMFLAWTLYLCLTAMLKHARAIYADRVLGVLVLVSAGYVSYSLGANDVGNAIGPLLQKFPDHGWMLALLGGIAMAIGALTFGKRVVYTVGQGIVPLNLTGAFSAQMAAAIGVQVFSTLGIPVSTSQAIVGAVIGIGLTKGSQTVRVKTIGTIVTGWVATPICAAVFAAGIYYGINLLVTRGGA
ncbi:MAG: PiT family inorganic phosphate transporter [Kiritimatiellia bacterium]|jgi:PiT family inorganic phosphate transporter